MQYEICFMIARLTTPRCYKLNFEGVVSEVLHNGVAEAVTTVSYRFRTSCPHRPDQRSHHLSHFATIREHVGLRGDFSHEGLKCEYAASQDLQHDSKAPAPMQITLHLHLSAILMHLYVPININHAYSPDLRLRSFGVSPVRHSITQCP